MIYWLKVRARKMDNEIFNDIEMVALKKNAFILYLPEELGITPFMVSKVEKSPHYFYKENENKLYVTIKQFDIGDYDAVKWCENFNNKKYDELAYSDLNSTGQAINKERYKKPRIKDISFSTMDYTDCGTKEFRITIKYDYVC